LFLGITVPRATCIHLPHAEGGFGVQFNDVTKDAAFYTTTSRFVVWFGAFSQELQKLWLPKEDLRDMSSWTSPPLVILRDIHSKLLTQYDWKEVCAPSQSQVNVGTGAGPSSQSQDNIGTGPRPSSQDDVSQLKEPAPLSLPQLNRLVESSVVWDENSVSNTDVPVIPFTVEGHTPDPLPLGTFQGPQSEVCGLASR
jgi:hypothetical protein